MLLYFTLPETVTPDHPAKNSAARGRSLQQVMLSLKQPRLAFVLIIYFLFIVAFSIMTTAFSLYTMFRFGYDAQHTGYLFAYVGLIAVIIQGGLIGRLVKRFGELPLVIVGALCFAISLFAVPFVGPAAGGLAALLVGGGVFSMGNSLATPALTSLASKSAGPAQQGAVLGVTQSVASLARAVGPFSRSDTNQQLDRASRRRRPSTLHERPFAVRHLLDRRRDHVRRVLSGVLFSHG